MDIDGFSSAIADSLGASALITGDALMVYTTATSGQKRVVPLAVRARSAADVEAVVAAARRFGVTVYPISQGKNWGLGSKLPPRDGSVILDLSGMTAFSVDEHYGTVTVQPGVTQQQLADYLAASGSRYFLDVTGSGAHTSILGNTMERGVAYNTLRAELVQSLQVVLGNGQVVRTGFAHFAESQIGGLCPFGIGPDLNGMFLQSNFGVVVEATIRLMPVPKRQATFLISVSNAQLPDFFEALRDLRREGALSSIVHVANRRRSEITTTPMIFRALKEIDPAATRAEAEAIANGQLRNDWSAIGCIMGNPGAVMANCWRVFWALRRFGMVRILTPGMVNGVLAATKALKIKPMRAFLKGVEPFLHLTHGVPTNGALHSTYWPSFDASPNEDNPDLGLGGIAFSAPVVPLKAAEISKMVATTERVGKEHGFRPAVTLNLMTDRTLEGVVSIDFVRENPDQQAAAARCLRALNQAYVETGCTPYRIDIDNMDLVVRPEDPFWQSVKAIKSVLDPDGVIAPGRFSPV